MVHRLLAFYRGLRELDEEYITEVEEAQLALIEGLYLPWFAQLLAKNPQYVAVPEDAVSDVLDGPRDRIPGVIAEHTSGRSRRGQVLASG